MQNKAGKKQYVSVGDFVDFFHLARLKGLSYIVKGLGFSYRGRSASKWNKYECSNSDFWVIPEVKQRWNELCTGSADKEYEDYVVEKYLAGKSNLKLLSVGCGNSSHEQSFSKHACFASVEGVDISATQVEKARLCALEDHCPNVSYRVGDFQNDSFEKESYDVVLFHSSIHHFKNIEQILKEKTLPVLKPGGLLIIFDYTGPNRLQWTKEQLDACNSLLQELPHHKKNWYNSSAIKKKVYRPGLFRMWVSDPSEAVDSESILKSLATHFSVLEEKKLGGNLIHPLLKGISQHFNDSSPETLQLLSTLFEADKAFAEKYGSDFTFGIYQKPVVL